MPRPPPLLLYLLLITLLSVPHLCTPTPPTCTSHPQNSNTSTQFHLISNVTIAIRNVTIITTKSPCECADRCVGVGVADESVGGECDYFYWGEGECRLYRLMHSPMTVWAFISSHCHGKTHFGTQNQLYNKFPSLYSIFLDIVHILP